MRVGTPEVEMGINSREMETRTRTLRSGALAVSYLARLLIRKSATKCNDPDYRNGCRWIFFWNALTVRGRSQLIVLQFRRRTLGFLPCFISLSLMQTTVSQVMSKALPRGSSSWCLMLL